MLAVSGAHDTLGPSRLCQKDRQPSFSTLQSDRARRLSITSNTTYSAHARRSTKFAAIANQATEGKSERVRNDADLRRDRRDRGDDDLACRRTLRRNADHDVTDLWEWLAFSFACFLALELVYRCESQDYRSMLEDVDWSGTRLTGSLFVNGALGLDRLIRGRTHDDAERHIRPPMQKLADGTSLAFFCSSDFWSLRRP